MGSHTASDPARRARARLRMIVEGAIEAGHAGACVRRHLERAADGSLRVGDRAVSPTGRVVALAVGKAAPEMAAAAGMRLGAAIDQGLAIVPEDRAADAPDGFECLVGDHPVAGARSLHAGGRVRSLAESLREGDLLLCLLSGGASALMESPAEGVEPAEIERVTRDALMGGRPIDELNRDRSRLSALKAGGLARLAAPASVAGLVLSDVVGDAIETIASGPSVAEGADVWNTLVGTNELLLEGASGVADRLGYEVRSLGRSWRGEARELGALLGRLGRELAGPSSPLCLLAAGETTVRVQGQGRGGRNQEVAMAAALALDGISGVWLASAGSDGRDGPTPAAGAIADGASAGRGRELGLDGRALLDDNDSWSFFDALGDHLVTGPTGTNLMDLQLLLVGDMS